MQIVHKIIIDLQQRKAVPQIYATQNDALTRAVKVVLYDGGTAWEPPASATVSLACRKPDKTAAWYDKLPDGSAACSVAGNEATAVLAPQVLTAPGPVKATVVFQDANLNRLATFPFIIMVDADPAANTTKSNNYYKLQNLGQVNAAYDAQQKQIEDLRQRFSNLITTDDTTVSAKPWSSKNTADKLCPTFTESGAVVTCEPVEDYPLEVVSSIVPVQSGTGDPSPDNIRPITGHDIAKLTRCGKNLIDPTEYMKQSSGTTLDGDVFTTKFTSGGSYVNAYGKAYAHPAGTYTVSVIPVTEEVSLSLFVYDHATGEQIARLMNVGINGYKLTFTATAPFRITVCGPNPVTGGVYGTYSYKLQLEVGSTAAAYEPYKGDTFTLDLGQTVYGGSLDWATGLLTITDKGVVMNELSWRLTNASSTNGYFSATLSDCPCRNFRGEPVLCNAFTPASQTESNDVYSVYKGENNKIVVGSYYFANSATVCIGNSSGQTLEEFTAELAENDAFLVYPLAEPITIQLTPQEITALSGVNTLYSDTGDTTVTGRADPRAIIQAQQELNNRILDRIAALEAAAVNNT